MALFGLIKGEASDVSAFRAAGSQYRRLRKTRMRLNDELVSRLAPETLEEGGRRLGIFREGVFVFGSENETSVLMDYCIYEVYRRGRNAVEEFLCDSPPDPDSDEAVCLAAMQHATYTVVALVRRQRGVGWYVRDLFTDEERLLVDMGLSKSGCRGGLLATRLLDFGDYVATTGAMLPLAILNDKELDEFQRTLRTKTNVPKGDPAPLIGTALEKGVMSQIRYEGADEGPRLGHAPKVGPVRSSTHRRRNSSKRRPDRAAKNRRCRCGSGKMFKNCCGKQ